jgi:hypothetical protein
MMARAWKRKAMTTSRPDARARRARLRWHPKTAEIGAVSAMIGLR